MRRIRVLHIVMGVYLTGFVLFHLCMGIVAWWPERYRTMAEAMGVVAGIPGVVVIGILLPLAVQATSGGMMLAHTGFRGGCRATQAPLLSMAQRLSALVIVAGTFIHVIITRWLAPFQPSVIGASASIMRPTGTWMDMLLSLVPLMAGLALAFHAGNGLWSARRFLPGIWNARLAHPGWAVILGVIIAAASVAAWIGVWT